MTSRITRHLTQFTDHETLWPNNIWIGVSVETMRYHWRVDQLRQVPAAVRFISAEPLLGPLTDLDLTGIHWLIVGGESGHGFRSCEPNWIRELRDRCRQNSVAFFFKQWGGRTPKARGRELDGETWEQYPDLAVGKDVMPHAV